MNELKEVDVVVIGAGPGGYTAAFRAADLGLSVALIERYATLGGVCLNVGCIPSKALLHAARTLEEAKEGETYGIHFAAPKIDVSALRGWKNSIIKRLTGGLGALAKRRKVAVLTGEALFKDSHTITVNSAEGAREIAFKHAIIAVGSASVSLPFIPKDERIFSATGALELRDITGELVVLGGGIIGLEMATVYAALGVAVTVIEATDQLIPAADADVVQVLQKRLKKKGVTVSLNTKLTKVEAHKDALALILINSNGSETVKSCQQLLVAVGRKPNGHLVGAVQAGVHVDERGFIPVDKQQRTNVPHIFAIGDVVGQPMLAHKATAEAKVAAEVISGLKHYFEPKSIVSVAYTDPEIAWVGLTEKEAKATGVAYEKGVFPWMASGRALSVGRDDGMTKVLFCPTSKRILGAGIVGLNAGELIAEAALAVEMECDVEDIALTIHPHPTLSETLAQATEVFAGTITDL